MHTHSTASDGTTPPDALVLEAAEAGLDVLALTDHDTTAGWAAAAAALPAGLALVRGAELSCSRDGISVHLLAYLFDPEEPALASQLAQLRASRVGRAEGIVRRLVADGVPVTWEQVQDFADGSIGRPHIAQALVASGLIASVADAFTPEWIGTHGRYWGAKLELDVVAAIALVRAAGGVTVLAHPGASSRGRTVSDEVIADLSAAGLAGLEVEHPDHDDDAKNRLYRLAAELDLLTTGSSDFHGGNKTVRLGAHLTPEESYEALCSLATGVPVLSR